MTKHEKKPINILYIIATSGEKYFNAILFIADVDPYINAHEENAIITNTYVFILIF